MSVDTYRIMCGAYGWLHPAWFENYYPEDLPAEWRLGYYGNEFPVVMFPASYWAEDDSRVIQWLEDSGDELSIICEFSSSSQLQVEASRLALISERCSGVVCKVDPGELDSVLIGKLSGIGVPACFDLAENKLTQISAEIMQELVASHTGLVWHGVGAPAGFEGVGLALTRVNTQGMDMRQLRQVMETVLTRTTPEQQVVLIFDGDPPALETIHNAQIMLDLL